MGQYFTPTLITEDGGEIKTFAAHAYRNGLKLSDHSYIGNNLVAAVLHVLAHEPHRLWWLGDYASENDFENVKYTLSENQRSAAYEDINSVSPTKELQNWDFDGAYIVNLDKKCFIQLEKNDEEKYQFCPLCLLTAVGNGKGGGDYYGVNMSDVGTWAGDLMVVEKRLSDVYRDTFHDATKDYEFYESWMKEADRP